MSAHQLTQTDRTERRLLLAAGAFLGLYSAALTLSNAVRLRTWQADYRWFHWVGFAIWAAFAWMAHKKFSRLLPERDPILFPAAALLTGWGLLTIWRLSTSLGLRQSAWLVLVGVLVLVGLQLDRKQADNRLLAYMRRYKYIWLTSGLLLTFATLILGTNPMGAGPRLWLGCCGFYFQPSEPLKLLLIVYLAAYLADRMTDSYTPGKLLPLLTPTLIMTGLALLLLVFQRDLGTAAIFLVLYAGIVYAGTGDRRILFFSAGMLVAAAAAGYALFDVVNLRLEAWISPWMDPSGRSYQIIQSLLAVANGGLIGRGPGLGSPSIVPIAQSDFIFSAISEESGLIGALAMLAVIALLVSRGMRTAMHAADPFQRLLSAGLVVHLAGQSILIIGGNVRLLPLTGVTLPFVSYGGTSLLVSFIELLCLVLISASQEKTPIFQEEKLTAHIRINKFLTACLMLGLAGSALVTGWWGLVRGPDLLTRTDNPRRTIDDRYVKRGSLLDRHGKSLAESTGQPGEFVRLYPYPALGPLVGYTSPVYGQAGLEASLDPYLRGLQGYPGLTLWWEHLLYGQPPPGLDVRLSIDLDLQKKADGLLSETQGAIVLLNASTGEVLAMASSPSFDANLLDSNWQNLVDDPNSPLYDRAGMGLYLPGNVLGPFLLAGSQQQAPESLDVTEMQGCAITPTRAGWSAAITAGCSEPLHQLAEATGSQGLLTLLEQLGLFTAPAFPVETLTSPKPEQIHGAGAYITGEEDPESGMELRVSPLQLALAAATLSGSGVRPSARLEMAVKTPQSGWVMLPARSLPVQVYNPGSANLAASTMADAMLPVWQVVASGMNPAVSTSRTPAGYAWYVGGTLPDWEGVSVAVAVLLEENAPFQAQEIGRSILQEAIHQ